MRRYKHVVSFVILLERDRVTTMTRFHFSPHTSFSPQMPKSESKAAPPEFARSRAGTAITPSHDFPTIPELMAVWMTKWVMDRKRSSHRTVTITADKEMGSWFYTIVETPAKHAPKGCLSVDGWTTVLVIARDGVPPVSSVLYEGQY